MIIARSPLRISFAGGSTDIPKFYENYGYGAVVSTTINKYVYVTLAPKFDGKVSIRYRTHENTLHVEDLKHLLIKNTLLEYGVHSGIELVVISEVPARGSGLGASSALALALCIALNEYTTGTDIEPRVLAERAAKIEIEYCNSPIGKQDHYASAFGGFNFFKFEKDWVERVEFPRNDFIDEVEGQSMLFYLNIERKYSDSKRFVQDILREQVRDIELKSSAYQNQRYNAMELFSNMEYEVVERFADHVNENWRIKRRLHKDISNDLIDQYIESAYKSGATAAKVCGAGGGGFLYLMVPKDMQDTVRSVMATSGLHELKFNFSSTGTEVVFRDQKKDYALCKD